MSNPEDNIENNPDADDAVENTSAESTDTAGQNAEEIEASAEAPEEALLDENPERAVPNEGDYERFAQVLKNAKEISARLEVLVPGVLDTADATNSAADVSRRASSALENGLDHLQKRVNELSDASATSAVLSGRILISSITALFVAVGLIAFISIELSTRVTQIDQMMVALSKRVVKMNTALATFEQMNYSINQLATNQAEFSERQMILVEAVSNAEKATTELGQQMPAAAAKSVSVETNRVAKQVEGLSKALKSQGKQVAAVTGSVKTLGVQLKSFDQRMKDVKRLNADVEALITLERAKYLDALRSQVSAEGTVVEEDSPEDLGLVVYPAVRTQ
ncbi:MAG: hypothetical protein QMB35_03500 [Porticoccaceae bacterium]